ncbi:filamentous hemagglutinin N-terminal domain-containing protein, partial [Salmonella enterica]
MNKIYKLKFDKRRNELVVVSEITAGLGKTESTGCLAGLTGLTPFRKWLGKLTPISLLTGLITGLLPMMVVAADLPAGGQIVAGQGSISTAGNTMTVTQGSHNMAATWHSFDIGKNNTVQFVQPDSSSVALNKVTGVSASQIMGTLNANGKVFLINPNGVLFGRGAHVNTAGFVASTKNLKTADFMQGNYTLSGGGHGAEIINQGTLTTTKGGFIVLAADRVSNTGEVSTPSGKTALIAADRVSLQLDNAGLTSVSVNGSVVNALVENRGLISATDGQVYLTARGKDMLLKTVVNNSGTVEAKGLTARGGQITLDGGDSGVVSQSGTLLADGHTGRGGQITLEGENIHLASGSLTSATGGNHGGQVFVGGGWQGKNEHLRNASKVVMDKGATVDVSATQSGDGGTAVLWSDDYTSFRGNILAKGGKLSGNGGQVETSSRNNLQAFGDVDASAFTANGRGGKWLLDPTDVTIVSGAENAGITTSGDASQVFAPSADGAQIGVESITSQLNKGTNVNITTSGADTDGQSGNITVNAAIGTDIASGTTANLTLLADNGITLNNDITTATGANKGKLNVNLLASGTTNNGQINLNNATVSLNGGDLVMDSAGTPADDTTAVNTIKVASTGGVNLTVGNLTAGNVSAWGTTGLNVSASGNIAVNSTGQVTLSHNGTTTLSGQNIDLTGNAIVFSLPGAGSTIGQLVLNATTGNLNLTLKDGSTGFFNNTDIGHLALQAAGDVKLQGNSTTAGTVAYLGGMDVSAGHDIIVDVGANRSGSNYNVIRGDNNASLHAGGNITLTATGNRKSGNNNASIRLNQSMSLTAGQAITLSGSSSGSSRGVSLDNVSLTASKVDISGSSQGDIGFTLTNITLSDDLKSLQNVTLSSASSSANTTNNLDSSVVTADSRDILLSRGVENDTLIDMNGTALFDNRSAGWLLDGSHVDKTDKSGSWLINNTSVNAGGDVSLTGVSVDFNNTIFKSRGNLSIVNDMPLKLENSTITVAGGDVSLSTHQGDLTVTATKVQTNGGAIHLGSNTTKEVGGLNLTGSTLDSSSSTGGTAGAINLSMHTQSSPDAIVIQDSILKGGAVSIDGYTASSGYDVTGVGLHNVTLSAGNVNITGVTSQASVGTGVSLTNMTLSGGVSDVHNLVLSSAGSSEGTVNNLDSSIIRSGDDLSVMMGRDLGSTTAVDGSSLTLSFDGNGWDNTTSGSATSPLPSGMNMAHDWILSNTSVQSAGDVTLKGVGFSHSTLNITGALNLSSDKWLTLDTDTLTTTTGVTLSGGQGVTLKDVSVSGNKVLQVDTAALFVQGSGDLSLSNAKLNVSDSAMLRAQNNLTLTNVALNNSGAGDITLQAAGADSARIQVLNSTLTTSGGNISLDRMESAGGKTALTVNVNNNSILTAGADADGHQGDIRISAWQPNINLDKSQYVSTVRNAGAVLQISGGSQLTGNNVTLQTTQDGSNAKLLPVFIFNASLKANQDLTLSGISNASNAVQLEIRGSNNVLSAGNNLTLSSNTNKTTTALYLNGNAPTDITLTAGGRITLDGMTTSGTGVLAKGVQLNAAQLSVNGVITNATAGTGFNLSNLTFQGGLADIANITLSSAGSSILATNTIGGHVFTGEQLTSLINRGIENQTNVDATEVTLGGESTVADWSQDFDAPGKGGGWIFNNATVSKSGNISLQNVGFTNSSLTAGNNLTLSNGVNNGNLLLSGTNLTATAGYVTLSTAGGDVVDSSGNISAGGGIVLNSQGGNILLGGNGVNALTLTTSTGDIALSADNNMTLNNATLNSTSGGNISLLAAGNDSAIIQVLKSNLSTHGGNITLDQLSHTRDDGSLSDKGMTVKIDRSSALNTGDSDGVRGDIVVNGYNPNVALSNAVRNSGAMVQVSGGSVLSANNITLQTIESGSKATGLPVFIFGATLSADKDILLNGLSDNAPQLEIRGNNNRLTAGNNLTISGTRNGSAGTATGVYLNGTTPSSISLTAENIVLCGTTASSGVGVNVSGVTLNAGTVNIAGQALGSGGYGFRVDNVTLQGGIASDINNLTLSGAGSAAGNTNVIGSGVINSQMDFDAITGRNLGLLTQVDGTYWSGNNQTYDDGLTIDNSSSDGWIYSNVNITVSGGDTVLKNTGFVAPQMLNISGTSLSMNSAAKAALSGDNVTINVSGDIDIQGQSGVEVGGNLTSQQGNISLVSPEGNITLIGADITADKDITVTATNGTVVIQGTDTTNVANIVSTHGNVGISGTYLADANGVTVMNTAIRAAEGNISLSGESLSNDYLDQRGSVYLNGNTTLSSRYNTVTGVTHRQNGFHSVGIVIGLGSNLNFDGNTTLTGTSETGSGIVFLGGYSSNRIDVNFSNGNNTIYGSTNTYNPGPGDTDTAAIRQSSWLGAVHTVFMNLNNATLNMTADASKSKVMGISVFGYEPSYNNVSANKGFVFTGNGDVNITALSNTNDALELRVLDNTDLTGHLSVTGISQEGNGILAPSNENMSVVNATITGRSQTGAGIYITTELPYSKKVDFNGNTLCGTSVSGKAGVLINGHDITLTNGTLTGIVTSGSGTGVALTGSTNYTISGANVSGQSADGAGVAAAGNLAVEDGAQLSGLASGNGSGVTIAGNLTNTDGKNVIITGQSQSGAGVEVTGNSALSNATLNGSSSSGAGVEVAKNLTVSGTSDIRGTSQDGTGINVLQNLVVNPATVTNPDTGTESTYVAPVTGTSSDGVGVRVGADLTGGKVTGQSGTKAGVELSDNATVTQAQISGQSETGAGVAVTGSITLDDTTASSLKANSVSGAGLSLEDDTHVNIINVTTTQHQKTDALGQPVVDEDGQPVMETDTSVAPVTRPVTLSGTSEKGSGIATSGNVSISGVLLCGSTSSETGTGVTLSGNLTIGDAISGVTASATGNGTALSLDNATVDATAAGSDFTISATVDGGDGTAIKTSGDSSLNNVALSGTTNGNGSAVVVSGSLSTDKSVTATANGEDNKGTALVLSGGELRSTSPDNTPVDVTVKAEGSGSAVKVAAGGDSALNNITLNAQANTGSTLEVSGNLSSNTDITVTTENGTALTLNGGSLQSADSEAPVKVNATATGDSGTAVLVTKTADGESGSSLGNITLNASATAGDGLNVQGVLNTQGTDISTAVSGSGTALNVSGGRVHSSGDSSLTATADNGQAAVITDGSLTGDAAGALVVTATTKTDQPALIISGTSEVSNSKVSGENSGDGSAVSIAGTVTSSGGGEITGHTENGTAIVVSDGASVTSTQPGGLVLNASATGDKGTGITLSNVTLTGSQVIAGATNGDAVKVTEGHITGGNIEGNATTGTGLNVSGNATLTNTSVSGATQTGTG